MKIVFMGTPEFALPSLKAVATSRHVVSAVVTGLDAERGRGLKIQEPPVKILANTLGLPVIQPENLYSPDFIHRLKDLEADLFVVVAFKILPDEVLEIPRLCAINLHASLLPKYRGPAPINWAIINGEKEAGLTIFRIQPKVDTGDILAQRRVAIAEDDTFGTLYKKLSLLGGEILVSTIDAIEENRLTPIPQHHEEATKAPKIYPDMGKIDWSKDATKIKCLIHGLSPTPGAFTSFNGKRIKFLAATVEPSKSPFEPGMIAYRDKIRIGIQTGNGILFPLKVQVEGKKPLPVAEFLRGFQGKIGDRFFL